MLLISDKWQTWRCYSFCYRKGLCFSFIRMTVMFYIHKTELIRHHQNVLSLYCLHFPCWNLNNFYPSKITSLQESQSKNSWFFTTGNTTITKSQQTAQLHVSLPFPRVPALHTTYSSKSIQVNCSFQIYNIFPGSVPASEHHRSCKCSEWTLFLWVSVLNAQKQDAIHSVIFHFLLTWDFLHF